MAARNLEKCLAAFESEANVKSSHLITLPRERWLNREFQAAMQGAQLESRQSISTVGRGISSITFTSPHREYSFAYKLWPMWRSKGTTYKQPILVQIISISNTVSNDNGFASVPVEATLHSYPLICDVPLRLEIETERAVMEYIDMRRIHNSRVEIYQPNGNPKKVMTFTPNKDRSFHNQVEMLMCDGDNALHQIAKHSFIAFNYFAGPQYR